MHLRESHQVDARGQDLDGDAEPPCRRGRLDLADTAAGEVKNLGAGDATADGEDADRMEYRAGGIVKLLLLHDDPLDLSLYGTLLPQNQPGLQMGVGKRF